MKKIISILWVLGCLSTAACGMKQYEESPDCDDLPMWFYDEKDESKLSDSQEMSIYLFESLQGDWQVTMKCVEQPDVTAMIHISEAVATNVELYQSVENSECASYGKAVFEAMITGSGDKDLDNVAFVLTADLMMPTIKETDLIVARSEDQLSQHPDVLSFALEIAVESPMRYIAVKSTTLQPYHSSSGSLTVTQRNECLLTNWVAQ